MNIVVFDFDRTLFDTNRYIKDLCAELNISKEQLYNSLDVHIKDPAAISMRSSLDKYLFDSSLECLAVAHEKFNMCILLTKSKYLIEYQKHQISNLLSKHAFDEVIITEGDKRENIQNIITIYHPDTITFVNDDSAENDAVAEVLDRLVPGSQVITIDNYSEGGFSIDDFLETMKE